MNKATDSIYHDQNIKVEVSVTLRDKDGNHLTNKFKTQHGYIILTFNPRRYFTVSDPKTKEKINIELRLYQNFVRYLKKLYDGFHKEDDIFLTDQLGFLMVNDKVTNKYRTTYTSYDMTLESAYGVIKGSGKEFEGIILTINGKGVIKLTHYDLLDLILVLDSVDILNYAQGLEIKSVLFDHVYGDKLYQTRSETNMYGLFK